MITPEMIAKLNEAVLERLPPGLETARQDIKSALRSALLDVFDHLDLVTKAEFEAQTRLLERTLKRIDDLEAALNELNRES